MDTAKQYDDKDRRTGTRIDFTEQCSRYCDFIRYESSVTPGLQLAMRVLKPEKPEYILATTHGWHMTLSPFEEFTEAQSDYLRVEVDMRGRPYSEGEPDCNGLELFDVMDAIEAVKKRYPEYILDPKTVYFDGGSGGGGNAMALAVKFPDAFAHISARCGISDYGLWYRNDWKGEFQDEMQVWIGSFEDKEAYRSRSGLTGVENLLSPLNLVHGQTDIRVPAYHSDLFAAAAGKAGKGSLVQYMKVPYVGGMDHWSFAEAAQLEEMDDFCEAARAAHRSPVELPKRGRFVIPGYLVTKRFSIMLKDISRVASVEYDLEAGRFEVTGVEKDEYTLKVNAE